ncbi:MAG: hypothetical protein WCO57_08360 [Verrucomicrobiota bacterium]
MNRSTFILGFATFMIAATLAASITMRNVPDGTRAATRPSAGTHRTDHERTLAKPPEAPTNATTLSRQLGQATHQSAVLRVALSEPWLTTLPSSQQSAWRSRAAAVELTARASLEHLTTELDLSAAQRDKMFPALVRSAPGYDPVMLVGGSTTAAATSLAALEEIHQVLDPAQQALVEDQEVSRQLWWQDTLTRLEANLIDSTGGVAAVTALTLPAAVETTPAAAERAAPTTHTPSNLFDIVKPTP